MARIFAITAFFALALVTPLSADAASLLLSSSSGSPAVGSSFSVNVYVSSENETMNGASGIVSFPKDKLEVAYLSKTGSIFSLWVQEPSFSNGAGTVGFEGIVLNPGFTGASGKILTITFKAKAAGAARVWFSSGSILANDGAGTNILSDMGNVNLAIAEKPIAPAATPTPAPENMSGDKDITITSSTHPDQTKWYANNDPEFSWVLPDGALEVRTLIGSSPTSMPTVRYAPAISSKKVSDLPDGTFYFHLQVRTKAGWSDAAHYRVNIDTIPPKPFFITFPHGEKTWEPRPIIFFNTTDDGSGISHYDIKIGDGGPERVAPTAILNPYSLPPQYPGIHVVTVSAVDEAGNKTSASEDFAVEAIDAPIITYYQKEIESGDIIKVRGTSYPDSDITLYFRDKNEIISEEYTKTNSSGDWALVVTKRFVPGAYTFTARVKDGRGAQSEETSPLTLVVNSRFLTELIQLVLDYLSAAILAVIALAALVGGGAYVWYRSLGLVRRLRRESREAERVFEKSFNILRSDINEHITRLKAAKSKRKLSAEEIAFLEQFEKELSEAKDIIAKEVEDISHS